MRGGIEATHQRCDGRLGVRRLRHRLREAHAASRDSIDGRRRQPRVAVPAHMIGAKRVDRDEEDVGALSSLYAVELRRHSAEKWDTNRDETSGQDGRNHSVPQAGASQHVGARRSIV